MNTKRKLLAMVLAAMMVFSLLPTSFGSMKTILADEVPALEENMDQQVFQAPQPPAEEVEPEAKTEEKEVKQEKRLPSVQLTNVDEQWNRLSGGVFKLEKKSKGIWKQISYKKSDNLSTYEGIIDLSGLKEGEYRLVQTMAPDGYELNTLPVGFTIAPVTGNTVIELQLVNTKTAVEPVAPPKEESTKIENESSDFLLKKGEVETILDVQPENNGDVVFEDENVIPVQPMDEVEPEISIPVLQQEEKNQTENNIPVNKAAASEQKEPEKTPILNTEKEKPQIMIPVPQAPLLPAEKNETVDNESDESLNIQDNQADEPVQSDQEPATNQGSAILTVKDEQGSPLPAAAFKLEKITIENIEVIHEILQANESGEIRVSELAVGTYQFTEVTPPTGFLEDKTPISFEIKTDVATEKKLERVYKKEELGSVILTVTDDESQVVSGAVFNVEQKDADGNWKIYAENLKTDEKGLVSVENIPLGIYHFVQTQAPEGYIKSEEVKEFAIESGKTQNVVEVSIQNAKEIIAEEKGTIELTVTNKEGTPIAGAAFKLEKEAPADETKAKAAVAQWELVKDELNTNADGKIKAEELSLGIYRFTQTAVPQGYVLNETPVMVTLEQGATQTPVQADFLNEKAVEETGSVELTVTDKEGKPVSAAAFKLEQKQSDNSWKAVKEGLSSDANGKVKADSLSLGTYRFVQTTVPQGYVLNETPITFVLEAGKTQTPVQAAFSNEKVQEETGSVELLLSDPNKTPIMGGGFKLEQKQHDGSWKTIQDNLLTNDKGIILVEKLALGDYRFIQTKAAAGYILDYNTIPFAIKAGLTQTPVKVTHSNRVELGSVELTNYGGNGTRLIGITTRLEKKQTDGSWKTIYDRLYTDGQGVVFAQNLELGEYRFIELTVPQGYQVDTAPLTFTIEAGKTDTPVYIARNHYPFVGGVQLKLTNKNGYALSGGEFIVSRNNYGYTEYYQGVGSDGIALWTGSKAYAQKLTADFYGNVYVGGLIADTYSFSQTKAPKDYQANKTVVKITLSNDNISRGYTPHKVMKNYLFGEIPPTGDETPLTALWVVAGVALVALVLLVVVSQKQKKKKPGEDKGEEEKKA